MKAGRCAAWPARRGFGKVTCAEYIWRDIEFKKDREPRKPKPTPREQSATAKAAMLERCKAMNARREFVREANMRFARFVEEKGAELIASGVPAEAITVGWDNSYANGVRAVVCAYGTPRFEMKHDWVVK